MTKLSIFQGTEQYYHIDKDKSIRENLNGKVIVEFPDFLIVPEESGNYYFDKVTDQIDYKKGQKPIKPPNFQDVKGLIIFPIRIF